MGSTLLGLLYKPEIKSANVGTLLADEGLFRFRITFKKFEDTKGIFRSRKSKDRQHNRQKKKDNDLQYNTIQYNTVQYSTVQRKLRMSNRNPTKNQG